MRELWTLYSNSKYCHPNFAVAVKYFLELEDLPWPNLARDHTQLSPGTPGSSFQQRLRNNTHQISVLDPSFLQAFKLRLIVTSSICLQRANKKHLRADQPELSKTHPTCPAQRAKAGRSIKRNSRMKRCLRRRSRRSQMSLLSLITARDLC